MRFLIHTANGRILRQGICQYIEEVHLNVGESLLELNVPDIQHYYMEGGVALQIPAKPADHMEFDWETKTWIDTRSILKRREDAIRYCKAYRDQEEFSVFVWNGHTVDADPVSCSRVQGGTLAALTAIVNNTPFTVDWTMADNSVVTLNAMDMVSMGLAFMQHSINQHEWYRNIKIAIEMSDTPESFIPNIKSTVVQVMP